MPTLARTYCRNLGPRSVMGVHDGLMVDRLLWSRGTTPDGKRLVQACRAPSIQCNSVRCKELSF